MTQHPTDHPGFLLAAASFAAERHAGQFRKSPAGTPYINHPLRVAALLAEQGGVSDPVLLAAALLHDTIEDTKTTGHEIEEQFGAEVRQVVEEVTDDKTLPKQVRKQVRIETAPRMSERARLLKLADMSCNLADLADHPPPDWSAERIADYARWAEAVAAGCGGGNEALVAAFQTSVARVRNAYPLPPPCGRGR